MRPAMEDAVRPLLPTSPGPLAHQTRCRNSWRVPAGANFGFTSRPLAPRHPARFRRHPRAGCSTPRGVTLLLREQRRESLFDDSLQRLQRLRQQHRSWSVRRRRSICGYRKYRTKLRTWSLRLVRQLFRLALSAFHVLATDASTAFKSPHNPPRDHRTRAKARVGD